MFQTCIKSIQTGFINQGRKWLPMTRSDRVKGKKNDRFFKILLLLL